MKELKKTQIQRSIRQFHDYSSDLCSADHNTVDDRLSRLIYFFSNDPFFSNIHKQLRELASHGYGDWFMERFQSGGGMSGSAKLTFPVEDDKRIAYMYELLCGAESGRTNLLNFSHHFFAIGSRKLDDFVYAFNEAISAPLFRDLGYKLEEMLEEIDDEEGSSVPVSSIQIIHHAENVIQQNASGTNIEQKATITISPELESLFQQLREQAGSNKSDLELIDVAEAEASKQSPKASAIKLLLTGLSFASSATGIIAGIINIIGG